MLLELWFSNRAKSLVGISMLLRNVTVYPLAKTLTVSGLAWIASIAIAWLVRKIPGVRRLFA